MKYFSAHYLTSFGCSWMQNYIRDIQFCPNDWAAPGRAVECEKEDIHVNKNRTRRQETVLHGKTIADVVEALIGNNCRH